MSGERVLIISDKLDAPTGFGVNASNIAWCLAKEYDVHILGIQATRDVKVLLDFAGEEREVIQHKNFPRTPDVNTEFGQRSLPKLLKELQPDLLLTINDIQMVQHVPKTLFPTQINVTALDMPSRRLRSKEEILTEIEAKIEEFRERYPPITKWLMYAPMDGDPPIPQWLNVYYAADEVVAMSKYGKRIFKDYFDLDVDYIWHAIDTDTFTPEEKPESLQGYFVVGDYNRNQPRKQPLRLIEAFAKFAKDKDDVRLWMQMSWTDPYGWPLEYFIRHVYNISDKTIWPFNPDDLKRGDIARIVGSFDIHVSPHAGEGFGLTMGEALSAGVPTIATDYTCYSDDTTVLTPTGEKRFDELCVGDLVYSLNEETEELEAKPITHIEAKDWDGEMIHFSSRYIDLLVTPDHKMVVKKRSTKGKYTNWQHIEAKDMLNKSSYKFPLKAKYNVTASQPDISDDLLTLIGWYISEGFIQRDYRCKTETIIGICEPEGSKYREEIINTIKKLGYKPTKTKNQITFHAKDLVPLLKECGTRAENKRIPRKYLNLSKDKLQVLFNALMKGDGSKFGVYNEFRNYTTVSKELATNIIELCIKLGYGAKYRIEEPQKSVIYKGTNKERIIKGNFPVYRVSIRYKLLEGFYRNGKGLQKTTVEHYKGKVWCVEVADNHNLLVGRNGKFVFCGNTSKELIVDGEPTPRGILVPPATLYWDKLDVAAVRRALIDIDKLVDAMNFYYYNRDELEKHGKNARDWAIKNLDIRRIEKQWLRKVKEVLNK